MFRVYIGLVLVLAAYLGMISYKKRPPETGDKDVAARVDRCSPGSELARGQALPPRLSCLVTSPGADLLDDAV